MNNLNGIAPEDVRACVLYDPEDGGVVHVHHFVTVQGAQKRSEPEIEREALEVAGRHGRATPRLNALHMAGFEIQPRTSYSVDPKTRTLVTRPAQAAARPTTGRDVPWIWILLAALLVSVAAAAITVRLMTS